MSTTLRLSVIVPVRNASAFLPRVLGSIAASDLHRDTWELIVVDDASTDDSVEVAAQYADMVIRIPQRPYGPAYARNRGFEVSRGRVVVFVDSDVVVGPDMLRGFVELLEAHADVGAVFGSYDDAPAAPAFISQYRNLLHHFVHQQNPGEADTFWAGAGAVKRTVFAEAGMFDEWHYGRPQIEDIELGGRIRGRGHRILLRPELEAKHLKAWTVAQVLRTDVRDRGVPWARLLAKRGDMASNGSLNLKWTEKLNTVLVWLALLSIVLAAVIREPRMLVLAGACVAVVGTVSARLLAFFVRKRGILFGLAVFPIHLLYYVLNGISFAAAIFLHNVVGPPRQDPSVEAFSEIGVSRWPPVPERKRPSTWTSFPEDPS